MLSKLQHFDLYDEPSSTAADVYGTLDTKADIIRRANPDDGPGDDIFDEQLIKALTLCYWSGRQDAVNIERRYDTHDERARRTEAVVAEARTVALANPRRT
jgi:hypothetical protein